MTGGARGGGLGLGRRRRLLLGAAAGTMAVGLLGLGASALVKSPAQVAAEQAPPAPSLLTAEVERRVLRDTVVLRGVVVPERLVEVTPSSSRDGGQLVVTGLRVREDDEVKEGRVLVEVSGRPVIVLRGRVPAFRDLRPGSKGRDVAQLQAALRRLGHPVGDAQGVFGAGTDRALAAFYDTIGYEAPATGEDDEYLLGDARARVRRAEREVGHARAGLRDAADSAPPTTIPGGSGGKQVQAGDAASLTAALEDAEDELADARSALAELDARIGPMLPSSEVVFLPAFPARVQRLNASVGGQVRAPMLVLAAGKLVATAMVTPADQPLLRKGQRAELVSEVLGISASGTVAAVGEYDPDAGRASAPGDAAGDPAGNPGGERDQAGGGFQLRIAGALDQRLAGQEVRVTVEAASTRQPVLVVPLAAVSASADGSSQVVKVAAGGREARFTVEAGASGDGFVEVRPVSGRLDEGDRVVVGR